MTWMWVAAGVLAGLCFIAKKNRSSREETEDIQEVPQAQAVPVTRNYGGTDEKRDLREAIRAGEHALDSLHAAMERWIPLGPGACAIFWEAAQSPAGSSSKRLTTRTNGCSLPITTCVLLRRSWGM